MTSLRTDEWPTNADDLAAIARDGTRPTEEQERAFQELMPTIRRVASRVAARFAGLYSEDIVNEASGQVWLARGGYEPGNSFEAWCYGVLRKHLLMELRRQQRERARRNDRARSPQAVEFQRGLEQALDRTNHLPQADLDVVGGWPVDQRLALLALSGLWFHVPVPVWEKWIKEYGTTHQRTLPDPFPPGTLGECDSLAQRNAILCEAMQAPRNRLSVWLYRRKPMLRELQYVREVMDNS